MSQETIGKGLIGGQALVVGKCKQMCINQLFLSNYLYMLMSKGFKLNKNILMMKKNNIHMLSSRKVYLKIFYLLLLLVSLLMMNKVSKLLMQVMDVIISVKINITFHLNKMSEWYSINWRS